jgi:two-component sensor histidine kinase
MGEPDNDLGFLAGAGDAGQRIAALDWTTTPLGPPADWPAQLKAALSLTLAAKTPAFLGWGPELLSFPNDAYAPMLAGRPEALGRPAAEVWGDIWRKLSPIVARAQAGEGVYVDNLELSLVRDGRRQPTWRSLSCSPVHGADGRVAGVLWLSHETTAAVLAERRQNFLIALGDVLRDVADPVEVMVASAGLLGRHLGVGRVGYGDVDPTGEIVTVERDWTDGAMSSLAGEARILEAFGPDVISELTAGRTLAVEDCLTDPRTATPAYLRTWESIGARALIVVPLLNAGRPTALLYAHCAEPHAWSDLEVALVEDVARRTAAAVERARAEAALREQSRQLRENEARLRLAIDAGRMAVWGIEAGTGDVIPSPELNVMVGLAADARPTLAELQAGYAPGELERLRAMFAGAAAEPGRYLEAEYQHIRADDGEPRWLLVRALVDSPDIAPLEALGVVIDVTERKAAEERLVMLAREVDHRANNLLTVVQGAVALTRADDVEGFRAAVLGRIMALGKAHRLLSESRWIGASIRRLVSEELAPFAASDRADICGPDGELGPAVAQGLAMALHELATNAAKYGALSVAQGRVSVSWAMAAAEHSVRLRWQESGGPPVAAPSRRGLGTALLARALSGAGGQTNIAWEASGVVATLEFPLS